MFFRKGRFFAVIFIISFLCFYAVSPSFSIAQSSTGPVALDAGHGGNDSGAVANGLVEKELNWKVTNYCKQRLEQLGIPTVMVRVSSDENPTIYERCARANNANARCIISFHFNSGGSSANGAELLIGNESAFNYWTVAEGKGLANRLLPSFARLGIGNRGAVQRDYGGGSSESYYPDGSMADYYGITRYARRFNMTGNIIEHGFLTNTHDASLFKSESVLQQLGYLDAEAIYAIWPSTDDPHWVYDGTGWKWRFDDGSYAISQWISSGDRKYYIGSDGYRVYGWNEINGKKYYFNQITGVSYTGWLFMWSCLYYFSPSNAAMVTGSQVIDGKAYYFDSNGVLTGWYQDSEGNTYYKDANDNSPKKGWAVIDSKTYYFLPENYHQVKGWATIGSSKYYFDSRTGVVHSGWLTMWDVKYYFKPSDYKMVTGKYTIDGKQYTFDQNGVLVGWFTNDQGDTFYYFPSDYHLAKGWNVIEGDKYYFDTNTGVAHSGWLTMWGVWYYFKPSDYKMVTGKYTIDGKQYTFDQNGVLIENSGWIIDGQGHTLYIDPNTGQLAKGWKVIDGEKYYFETNTGYVHSGWLTMWDVKYYFKPSDYKMVTGKYTIDGKEYCFNQDGVLITYKSAWVDGNGNLAIQNQPSTKVKWYDANGNLAWTRTTNTPAMSASAMTKDAFISSFSKRIASNYPSIYVSNPGYGAQSPQAFAEVLWNSAVSEGVRPEFLAAQVADETGWLKFGGAVPASACNFGGIGAVDHSPQSYAVFPDIPTGLLAQAQHIKAYSSTAPLNNPCVDPRFHLVTRGVAPYIEDYGWGMWASNPTYNIDLLRIMSTIVAG